MRDLSFRGPPKGPFFFYLLQVLEQITRMRYHAPHQTNRTFMPTPHLIFDFDGVIADTLELNWQLVHHLHPETTRTQYQIDHHRGNVFEAPVVPFTDVSVTEYYRRYNESLSLSHIEDAIPALHSLGAQYRLHIVSSNCELAITRVLTEAGIDQDFGLILGKEAHESKVEKFHHLASAEHFSLTDALFITDTLGELLEAQKVGVPAIAVSFGYHPDELLAHGAPRAIVHTWDEAISVVGQQFERLTPVPPSQ
jgi:phosphoglycolate phosphatase-like HAD superfamily hydrolase